MKSRTSKGFTLVEIALALLVASIGLVGLFSLFPAGVQMNKMAIDETQAAMFADQILNGVRAQASTQRWDQIKSNIDLPPVTPHIWENSETLRVRPTDAYETLRFTTEGALSGQSGGYLDFSIRYRLQIQDVQESDGTLGRRKIIRLYLVPGEYGPVTSPYLFYTEIYNHGQR